MFIYFKNRKIISFYDLCLNLSIETKVKTLFIISSFNLSKKWNDTLGIRIVVLVAALMIATLVSVCSFVINLSTDFH